MEIGHALKFAQVAPITPPTYEAFQVPDGHISSDIERMHDWCEQHDFVEWEGDESGITITHENPTYDQTVAAPGDWIVKHGPNDFRAYTPQQLDAIFRILG